jgi:hypothetical protein
VNDGVGGSQCRFNGSRIPYVTCNRRKSLELVRTQIEEGRHFIGASVKTSNLMALAEKTLD